MNLFLLQYANYKNRIIRKPLPTVDDYTNVYGATQLLQLSDVYLWNPNDGIVTTQVLDTYTEQTADYLLVANDYGEIVSRWYVMDATRTLQGQYKLSLLRDVIADYYNEVLGATCFIEKATVSVGDPAIYNEEPFRVNQILTRKDLLYDETECPWIVGYIPKNYPEDSQSITFNYTPAPDITVTNIEQWEYYNPLSQSYWAENQILHTEANYIWSGAANNFKAGITLAIPNRGPITATTPTNANSWDSLQFESPIYVGYIDGEADGISTGNPRNFREYLAERIADLDAATIYSYAKEHINIPSTNSTLEGLVGKIVFDRATNTSYRVVRKTQSVYYSQEYTAVSGPLWQALSSIYNARPDNFTNLSTDRFHLVGPYNIIKYELSTLGAEGMATLTNNRTHLIDQPYDMFVMPYSNDLYLGIDNTAALKFSKEVAMGFAQQMAANIGSSAVFDIQILPYCPIKNLYYVDDAGRRMINFKEIAATAITTSAGEGESARQIGALFWCSSSQFSFEIPYYIDLPSSSLGQKLMSICDKYRLCSPNMASFFDFDPVKNNGVAAIEVDCYYKPYNPYIHLNPKFGGIYGGGTDYEVRGLDLSGNFSLTQVSDAWTNYQLQNKNFQNVFDRQQANITKMREYERTEQIVGGVVGAVGAGVQTGLMTGNVYAGIGAGIASAGAGVADIFISEGKYKETLDYNKTIHQYSLENIQALPQSLTKVDALSPNNPLIPYIECYTCTAIEKGAIRNNLLYGGMTVGRIGSLAEFQYEEPSFMKAQLIRIEGLQEDYHFADTISQELKLGVFI